MKPTILCVDDQASIVATIAGVLRSEYDVLTATDPETAYAIMHGHDIAVVISDFEMPKLTGIEFLVQARAIQPEATRVLLTAHRDVETALAGINQAGIFRYVTKPFAPEALRAVVADAVAYYRDAMIVRRERQVEARRRGLMNALADDHPGITTVSRDPDGRYLVGVTRAQTAAELASVLSMSRR